MVTSEIISIFHEVYHLSTFFIPIVGLVKKLDQFRFQGNCPPTPPLTQHFATNEK